MFKIHIDEDMTINIAFKGAYISLKWCGVVGWCDGAG